MLTIAHLARIMRHASQARLAQDLPALDEVMRSFGVTTVRRAAAFIAQLAHESGEWQLMEELWGPTPAQKRYEPPGDLARRLGNTEPGDGKRFKGRGPIQITGRASYQRYGGLLGLDLAGQPQLAATPEVGFKTAALFWQKNGLNELADAGNFRAITQRISGGQNGAAQRERLYALALEVLKDAFPAGVPAGAGKAPAPAEDFPRGAEALREEAGLPAATGRPKKRRVLDARPDTMDFRDLMYVPTLVEVPTHIPLGNYLDQRVPILDQGSEGACTGFALATVANFLLLRRRVLPDPAPVSPRMFYDLARRYDEWPGEDYSGSSARGAMKGWHKHGVCAEALYPTGARGAQRPGLTDERTSDARRRPLGAYFRVNHKDLVAMHSALAEVGILYATCAVHEGWQAVGPDGLIEPATSMLGGHAFAIVAYDDEGFWLQNSWGPQWGRGGFARISYDDWLRNGTDVWVARLGAPVTLHTLDSTATAHASTSGQSVAYSFADLRPHIVSVGNDGALRAGGDYGVTPEGLRDIFRDDIPRVTRDWGRLRILLYAHGGLVDERSAVQRLAEYRPALLQGQVYPLAFIWRSDYWTTITNILQDAVRRRRPEGVLDAAKDFMLDRLDDALEPLARAFTGRSAWSEMKENALAASGDHGAARLVVDWLQQLPQANLEIHLVGHSAGSILQAPLVSLLGERGLPIESCTLWAPACTVDLFTQTYLPAIRAGQVKRFSLFVLDEQAEQDDNCAGIYNKSLLYLVSNAFEAKCRIPGFRDGVPILGMAKFLDASLRELFKDARHRLVVAPNQQPADSGLASEARHHGDFDDDRHTVAATFASIVGGATAQAASKAAGLQFRHSASALRDKRVGMDARTALQRSR